LRNFNTAEVTNKANDSWIEQNNFKAASDVAKRF
jgi:hypothetical protein